MRPGAAARAGAFALAGFALAGAAAAHDFGALRVDVDLVAPERVEVRLQLFSEHLPPAVRALAEAARSSVDAPESDELCWARLLESSTELVADGARVPLARTAVATRPNPDGYFPVLVVSLAGALDRPPTRLGVRSSLPIGPFLASVGVAGASSRVDLWIDGAGTLGEADLAALAPPSRLSVVARYVALGFEHILPKGLDHILFVLGLFLLATTWASLLWQVSAFTLAHTISLALSIYGVVRLPSSIVEPLIALSIAYVGFENVAVREMKPWRPVVVFAFGLLHGLGFAGVLTELGLPRQRFATALLAFNVGVELGQVAVLALAFLLVGIWARRRADYRRRVVVPGSLAIAAAGLYWTIERLG